MNSASHERDARRAEIDAQLAQMHHLKFMRNTLAPISMLPQEVLLIIFTYYRNECYYNKACRLFEWVGASHVCSQWRAMALAYPRLWSSLFFDERFEVEGFDVLMARSKSAPLAIFFHPDVTREGYTFFLLEVLDSSDRFEQLDFSERGSGRDAYHLIRTMSAMSAPRLQSMSLTYLDWSNKNILPQNIFGGGTPALRNLTTLGWSLRATPSLMNGLTTFKIEEEDLSKNPWGDLYLLDALKEMGNLRELSVLTSADTTVELSKNGPQVRLPHLQVFAYYGPMNLFTNLLGRLIIPSSTYLDCDVNPANHGGDRDLDKDFVDLVCSLKSSQWLSRFGGTIQRIQVFDDSDNPPSQLNLQVWFQAPDPTNMESHSSTEPNLMFAFMGSSPCTLIRHILTTFPLQDVQSVYLDVELRKKDCRILGALPVLRSLFLTEESFGKFFNYISRDPVMLKYQANAQRKILAQNISEGIPPPPPKYFPKLECLEIYNADFGLFDYEMEGIEDEAVDMDTFIEVLMFRQTHRVPIRRLELYDCINVVGGEVELMKEVVEGVVEWNGWESVQDDFDLEEERGIESDLSDSDKEFRDMCFEYDYTCDGS